MFGAKIIQWHYSEAGHGKGAPDGIGGCLKRTADGLVAQGQDIATFDNFMVQMKKCCKGIDIFAIEEDSIFLYEKIPTLKAFVGTLKVHPVIWTKPNEDLQAKGYELFQM